MLILTSHSDLADYIKSHMEKCVKPSLDFYNDENTVNICYLQEFFAIP